MLAIDMTPELGSLITSLLVILMVATAAVAFSVWRSSARYVTSSRPATDSGRPATDTVRHLAIVGASPSVPAKPVTPSDTSVPEAA